MTNEPSWIALAMRVINQQDQSIKAGRETVRIIRQFRDALLARKKLTTKQQSHFIKNINLHLGREYEIDQPPIVLTSRAVYYWRNQIAAKPKQARAIAQMEPHDHWQALLQHHGSWQEILDVATQMLAGEQPADMVPVTTAAAAIPLKPAKGPAKATLSMWVKGSKLSGNLDYRHGDKQRVVFCSDWEAAKGKLAKAGNQIFRQELQGLVEGAMNRVGKGHQMHFGLLHGQDDAKGKKAALCGGQLILACVSSQTHAVEVIAHVDGATGLLDVPFEEKVPTGYQPNIKAAFDMVLR